MCVSRLSVGQFDDTPARRARARRADLIGGTAFSLFAVGFLGAWIVGLGVVYLFASIANATIGGRMLRNHLSMRSPKEN